MQPVTVMFVVLVVVAATEGVKFTRCGLVKQLKKHGFPKTKLRNWVCLVEHESGRNTDVVSPPNKDGSRDYGLFQINSRYWCSPTDTPGKDCNVTCMELLGKHISKASSCAKKIYGRHGFGAWYGWKKHCKGKPLPDISMCK